MPKQLFQCEKCGSMHPNESNAELCEKKHLEPEKQELVFSNKDRKNIYPQEIKLWFGTQCITYSRDREFN